MNVPKVGDKIYVKTSVYIDHEEDDFHGGLCTISEVAMGISAGKPTYFVTVKENPFSSYNYDVLLEQQDELRAIHGSERGFLYSDLPRIRADEDMLELQQYRDACDKLIAAKDDPERLRMLIEHLEEYGPNGPAGIGLGNYGGHAIG